VVALFSLLGVATSSPEDEQGATPPAAAPAASPPAAQPTTAPPSAAPPGAPSTPVASVPADAAAAIQRARAAIAARDFAAIEAQLHPMGNYLTGHDGTVSERAAAVRAWRDSPELLARIDRALAAPCEVEPPEDGQIMLMCPADPDDGELIVHLSNMVDDQAREDLYLIMGVDEL
jgi:hypothetical protein